MYRHANSLGARNLTIIKKSEISRLEPHLKAHLAIYSPSSGIIDSHGLMSAYEAKITNSGSDVVYNHEVIGLDFSNYWQVTVKNEEDIFKIETDWVINSAGLHSDKIAKMVSLDDYHLNWVKGNYFKLVPRLSYLASRLINPIPEPNKSGLGTHVTIDLAGHLRLGPDVEFIEKGQHDYSVDLTKKDKFLESARSYFDGIQPEDILPDYTGIRPKIQKKGEPQKDFIIKHEEDKGLSGFINLIGIESPGLTASLEIAKFVAKIIEN